VIQNENSAVVRHSWFVSRRTSVTVCKFVPTCAAVAILSFTAIGCATVGPDYTRPVVTPPDAFRGAATGDVSSTSVADARWATLFQDEPLRELITGVLNENYDLKIAAARILQAQAQFGVVRSNQFPTIDAGTSAQGQRTSVMSSDRDPTTVGVAQLGRLSRA
jgi:multidrug efflux system outer membrane protein